MEVVDRPTLVDTMTTANKYRFAERPLLRPAGEGSVANTLQIDEHRARAVAGRLGLPHTGFLLSRPRLNSAVRPALDGGVIGLTAGPGCGKTAFIMDLLAAEQGSRFYLALDEADRDPTRFLKYLVATVSSQQFGSARPLLDWSALDGDEGELAEFVERLVLSLAQSHNGHAFLAIDDLHHVDSSPSVILALELLLRGLYPHWTVVLSSRRPLPCRLDAMALNGRFAGLAGRQLRLTPSEIAAWMAKNWGTDLSLSEARALWRLTQGWPAALVLLGQRLVSNGSLVGRDDVLRVIAQGRDLRTYLEEDVVAGLDEPAARIMLTAGLVPQVVFPRDGPVFEDDAAVAEQTLEQLVSRGLLVAACGRRSFLVHPLVRAYAERELLGRSGRTPLVEKIAAHMKQIGENYHAARLYVRLGRMDKASRPLRSLVLSSLDAAASFALEERSGLVPDDGADPDYECPWFMLCRARGLQQRTEYAAASGLYERATRLLAKEGDKEGLLLALLSFAFCLYVQARWEESLAILARARTVAQTAEERAEVLVAEGHVLVSLCRWDEGVEDWEKAIILAPKGRRTSLMHRIHLGRARLFHSLGDYHVARQWAEKAAVAETGAGRANRVMALHAAATLACLVGDYEESERLGVECKRLADVYRLTFMEAPILLAQADLALGKLDYRAAVGLCKDAKRLAAVTCDSDSAFWAEMMLGDLCRCNRNSERALAHHRSAFEIAANDGLAVSGRARSQSAQGMDLVLLGREKEARVMLEEAVRISRHWGLKASLVSALFYLGWINACEGQEHEAACSFKEAMRIAQEHGHVHFFNQEARVAVPIFALCDRFGAGAFLRKSVVPLLPANVQDYFNTLAKGDLYPTDCRLGLSRRTTSASMRSGMDKTSGNGVDSVSAKIGSLTEREWEILKAIAGGMPNKVIGAQLFISEKTVKTHANHILRKLGVSSRLQATLVFQTHQKTVAAGTALRNRRR